jgi:hypothetical protein
VVDKCVHHDWSWGLRREWLRWFIELPVCIVVLPEGTQFIESRVDNLVLSAESVFPFEI